MDSIDDEIGTLINIGIPNEEEFVQFEKAEKKNIVQNSAPKYVSYAEMIF